MGAQHLKGHLDSLLLAVLADGRRHGYGIIEQLRQRSNDFFELPEGTVYPALHRLEREGLVRSAREAVGGRQRRVYELSRRGRTALASQRSEWERFSSAVSSVLQGGLA